MRHIGYVIALAAVVFACGHFGWSIGYFTLAISASILVGGIELALRFASGVELDRPRGGQPARPLDGARFQVKDVSPCPGPVDGSAEHWFDLDIIVTPRRDTSWRPALLDLRGPRDQPCRVERIEVHTGRSWRAYRGESEPGPARLRLRSARRTLDCS
ncbi:MAG: hypothetical protein GY913_17655 [Proteobacteria bacterium]|nr:hypothetical protein [Pseudomonadota bacterium]MCP4918732.1 hypothetical protein [Pseudomonadota bacterium]